LSDRLGDPSEDCRVIEDFDGNSIAEMICPADDELRLAELIVRAVNAFDSQAARIKLLEDALRAVEQEVGRLREIAVTREEIEMNESSERRDSLLKRLAECASELDTESAHATADEALLDFIDDPEVTAAWQKVEKWYA
jgi:site-specific recombinase